MTTATAEWVVVVEAEAADGEEPIEVWRLGRLLEQLAGRDPVGLHSAERVAVQIRVPTPDPAQALRVALVDFEAALARVEGWALRVIRAEVLSLEEYEADCRSAYGDDDEEADAPARPLDGDGEEIPRLGEQLLQQAFEDPLTRLPARGLFMGQLERALVRHAGPAVEAQAVVVVNLSGMGALNARWGRAAGDEVLVTSARRLQAALPPGHSAGRIAGEEFAVVVPRASEAEALTATLLEALGRPVCVGATEVHVAATAGIATTRRAEEAADLLAQARAAARAARHQAGAVEHHRPGPVAAEGRPPAAVLDHDPLGYLLLMQRAAMAANDSRDLAQAAGVIVGHLCAHLGFALGHLYLACGDRLVPAPLARSGPGAHDALVDFLAHLRLEAGQGLAGRVLAGAQPAWVDDVAGAEAGSLPWAAQAIACGLNAAVAFPITVGREVVAVLELFATAADAPDDALVEVLRGVGSQLGRVVERHRALTRVPGREGGGRDG